MKVTLYERKRSKLEFVKDVELKSVEEYRKLAIVNRNQTIFIVDNRIYDNEGLICLLYAPPAHLK